MKILFVVNSLPFPARNGVELPVERLAGQFAEDHVVDFLVVGRSPTAHADFSERLANAPSNIRSARFLRVNGRGPLRSFMAELLGRRPMFSIHGDFCADDLGSILKETYDFIWVSPVGCLGLVEMLTRRGTPLKGRIVVGLNDATYGTYANGRRLMFKRRDPREWRRMLNTLRTPWLFLLERKLLGKVFAVHVQTPLEQRRVERLFRFAKRRPAIICKQNGSRKIETFSPTTRRNDKVILFMTNLAGARRNDCRWFLKKVWPRILRQHEDAQLWLVGLPPKRDEAFARHLPPNVRVLGYVDDLGEVFRQASLAVVPTLDASGWINRIADYLRAGLPIVANPEPLSTVPGLVPGVHAESAARPAEFAAKVNAVLADSRAFESMVRNGQRLAMDFPDWQETADFIERRLIALKREDEH